MQTYRLNQILSQKHLKLAFQEWRASDSHDWIDNNHKDSAKPWATGDSQSYDKVNSLLADYIANEVHKEVNREDHLVLPPEIQDTMAEISRELDLHISPGEHSAAKRRDILFKVIDRNEQVNAKDPRIAGVYENTRLGQRVIRPCVGLGKPPPFEKMADDFNETAALGKAVARKLKGSAGTRGEKKSNLIWPSDVKRTNSNEINRFDGTSVENLSRKVNQLSRTVRSMRGTNVDLFERDQAVEEDHAVRGRRVRQRVDLDGMSEALNQSILEQSDPKLAERIQSIKPDLRRIAFEKEKMANAIRDSNFSAEMASWGAPAELGDRNSSAISDIPGTTGASSRPSREEERSRIGYLR